MRAAPRRTRRSTTSGSDSSPVSEGTTSTRSSQRSRGASSSAKRTREPSICPARERSTCVFAPPSRAPRARAGSRRRRADGRGLRQRPRVQRVAEREVVLLDRDDVREVGADLERELEARAARASRSGSRCGPASRRRRSARARSRASPAASPSATGCGGRRRPRSTRPCPTRAAAAAAPLIAELEPREEARVLGEEAARAAVEVAELVADAERRAFEDRHRHRGLSPRGGCARRSTARAP